MGEPSTLGSHESDEREPASALHILIAWLLLQPEAAAVTHFVWLIEQVHPSLRDSVSVVSSQQIPACLAVGVLAHHVDVSAHGLAHQWEPVLTEHLAQCLSWLDYLDVVAFLHLPHKSANAW